MTDTNRWVGEMPADKLDLLIRKLRQARPEAPARGIPRRDRADGPLPLSFGQQQLWFLERMEPGTPVFNLPAAVLAEGCLRPEILERCLAEIERRHEALRTRFDVADGRPVQVPRVADGFRLPVCDLGALPEAAREAEAARLSSREARRPFDLGAGRLLRATLLRLAADRHLLLLTLHHLAADAWSIGLLVRELGELYAAFSEGRPSPLPEPPVQYGDFAAWQREHLQGETLGRLLGYWRERLAGWPAAFELPTDRPRPAVQTFHGARVPVRIDPAAVEGLRRLAATEGTSLFAALLAVFETVLARWTGQEDAVVGTAVADRPDVAVESLLGLFVNTVVLRTGLSGDPSFREALRRVRETTLGAFSHASLPFQLLVEDLQPERDLSRSPLFQVFFALQNVGLPALELPGLTLTPRDAHTGASQFDLSLSLTESPDRVEGWIEYNADLFDAGTAERLGRHLIVLAAGAAADPDRRLSDLPLLPDTDLRLLESWSGVRPEGPVRVDACLHDLFRERAARTPDEVAAVHRGRSLTFRELDARAGVLARRLGRLGVRPGDRVGVCADRSLPMLAALLGVLKAGAAYVPLDPAYPPARLSGMIEDAGLAALVVHGARAEALARGHDNVLRADASEEGPGAHVSVPAVSPAYVLYTSGSTGRPKGVMVSHGNAAGFFAAMDGLLEADRPGVWLAVTSISFDISVLELLWTLTRGFRVVVQDEPAGIPGIAKRAIDFSLFYFADAAGDRLGKYRLLMEGARLADERGFQAVWTPERHFHSFGGLYPNPSVTGAAVAAVTRRVQVRAGSVVLPLHDPLRVAEEWSVVDNLSEGRVGVSFASGWHADDFVLAPDRYDRRHEALRQGIDTVRRLWRGEAVRRTNGAGREIEVRVQPRPIQSELPVWLTAAGSPETFRLAGELGTGLLTHLLGQTVEEAAEKIRIYREAWRAAGHTGEGHVTLMLHTFVGTDEAAVRDTVRAPFTEYLRSSVGLVANLARGLGIQDLDQLSEDDMQALLGHAFDRYFEAGSLFGTVEECLRRVDRFRGLGVDEIGCLIDFGVDTDAALDGLRLLADVRDAAVAEGSGEGFEIPAQIARHGVTHFQCTPSLAGLLAGDAASLEALSPLRRMLVGGEALPAPLAAKLRSAVRGEVHNVYGPTETTIWSLTHQVGDGEVRVPVGRPLANNELHLLDPGLRPVPPGLPGEVCLGGDGVTQGYWRRPDLTAERFVPDAASGRPGARLYRTGDLGRFRADGAVEFLGRIDHQVKIRGHRIELGEIEAVLRAHPGLRDAAVVARDDGPGGARLAAYVVPAARQVPPLRPVRELREDEHPFRLPNGMTVSTLSDFQAAMGYQEVFQDAVYLRHGVTLPDGACILDIGANIGFFTLFASQRCRRPRIYAFEPFPPTFATLRTNIELYGLEARLFNRGLADRPGRAEFTFYPNAPGLSGRYAGTEEDREETRSIVLDWLERSGGAASLSAGQVEEAMEEHLRTETFGVELVTLSDVLREHGIERVDLLKIDTEKSEVDILAGIRDEDWPRIDQIVLEIHGRERLEQVSALLRARGYGLATDEVTVIEREGLRPVHVYMLYALPAERLRVTDPAPVPAGAADLRGWLAERLPEPMIPAVFVEMESLPLTGSGKIDRRALPEPGLDRPDTGTAYVAPRGSLEETIAAVWRASLGRDHIGVHDNFFEAGGNSLLLVQVHARLKEALGREVTLVQLFRYPTIQGLARFLESDRKDGKDGAPISQAEDRARLRTEAVRQRAGLLDRQKQALEEARQRRGRSR